MGHDISEWNFDCKTAVLHTYMDDLFVSGTGVLRQWWRRRYICHMYMYMCMYVVHGVYYVPFTMHMYE